MASDPVRVESRGSAGCITGWAESTAERLRLGNDDQDGAGGLFWTLAREVRAELRRSWVHGDVCGAVGVLCRAGVGVFLTMIEAQEREATRCRFDGDDDQGPGIGLEWSGDWSKASMVDRNGAEGNGGGG